MHIEAEVDFMSWYLRLFRRYWELVNLVFLKVQYTSVLLGNALSFYPNRLIYFLDLLPCVLLSTPNSSSFVAGKTVFKVVATSLLKSVADLAKIYVFLLVLPPWYYASTFTGIYLPWLPFYVILNGCYSRLLQALCFIASRHLCIPQTLTECFLIKL
jgi:hypothetical protein